MNRPFLPAESEVPPAIVAAAARTYAEEITRATADKRAPTVAEQFTAMRAALEQAFNARG